MLGCATSRAKPGYDIGPSVVQAKAKGCVQRAADSVAFEFDLQGVGTAKFQPKSVICYVQALDQGTFSSSWVPMPNSCWYPNITSSALVARDFEANPQEKPTVAPKAPVSDGSDQIPATSCLEHAGDEDLSESWLGYLPCLGLVSGLAPEKDYVFRVLVQGSTKEQIQASLLIKCRTSDRPQVEDVRLTSQRRTAYTLDMEWQLQDPEGAPVTECEVQYRPDAFMASWLSLLVDRPCGQVGGGDRRCAWRSKISGLEGSSSYRFRVRAQNAAGWSIAFVPDVVCWTSDKPKAPEELVCCGRRPASAILRFLVMDPEGAPVHTFNAFVHGVMGYSPYTLCRFEEEPVEKDAEGYSFAAERHVLCIVEGLASETEYSMRLSVQNDSGASRQQSQPVRFRTSKRPESPDVLCVEVGPQAIAVEWDQLDPVGAPVLSCELEYCKDSMFGSWEKVEAAPVAIVGDGMANEDLAEMAAAMEVARLTAINSMQRRWRVMLEGLDRETSYLLRAQSMNCVGWSENYSPTVSARTSDRPPAPHSIRCISRLPAGVWLEVSVAEVLGTPPVNDIVIEKSYSLSWQEVQDVEVKKVRTSSNASHWQVFVTLGITPGMAHELRAWAINVFGRSSKPSETCVAQSSDKPNVPSKIRCSYCLPHAICLEWMTTDPEGAPVWRFQVQGRKDVAFSGWHTAHCVDTQRDRRGTKSHGFWRSVIEKLDANTSYRFIVRALSEVGWSEWSAEMVFDTSLLPLTWCPPPMLLQVPAPSESSAAPATEGPTSGLFCVDLVVEDPEGAPAVACLVRLRDQPWRLARREALPNPIGVAPVKPAEELPKSIALSIQQAGEVAASSQSASISEQKALPLPAPASSMLDVSVQPQTQSSSSKAEGTNAADSQDIPAEGTISMISSAAPSLAPVGEDAFAQGSYESAAGTSSPPIASEGNSPEADDRADAQARSRMQQKRITEQKAEEDAFAQGSYESAAGTSSAPIASEGNSPEADDRADAQVAAANPKASAAGIGIGLSTAAGDKKVSRQSRKQAGEFLAASRVKLHNPADKERADKAENSPKLTPRKARPVSVGRWRVFLPRPECSAASEQVQLSVRIANACGWGKTQEHRLMVGEKTMKADGDNEVESAAGDAFSHGTLDVVAAGVRDFLASQKITQEGLQDLVSDATARNDQEHIATLSAHKTEVEQRLEVLQEVAQQVDASLSSREDEGAVLARELQAALARPKLAPTASVAATVLSLLLRGFMWLERSWRLELKSMTDDMATARSSIPASGGSVLLSWAAQHQAWSESFDRRVADALPEGLARSAQLLATLASGRKLEFAEAVRGDLDACMTLVVAAERQLQKLRNSHRILCASEGSRAEAFEEKGVLKKIETTALGLVTMLVLPVPGSIEIGTINIALLWVEGDVSRSHLAVQHPTGVELGPMLQRLGSSPPPRAAVIIAGWLRGGHTGVVLVHNATSRRIMATVVAKDTLASKAMSKLADAHPYMRMMAASKEGGEQPTCIQPTDVALIQVPEATDQEKSVHLEFAYGHPGSIEKAVGFASMSTGSAVSFVRLDAACHVSNQEAGENMSVEEGTMKVVNNDLTPVSINIFRAPEVQKHFEGALVMQTLAAGETKHVPLPQPCSGRIFKVDVSRRDTAKEVCEVRAGQCLIIES